MPLVINILCFFICLLFPFISCIRDFRQYRSNQYIDIILDVGDRLDILDVNIEEEQSTNRFNISFGEIAFVGIAPILGIFVTYGFNNAVFYIEYFQSSLLLLIVFAYIGYWGVRLFKESLPSWSLQICISLAMIGFFIMPVLFIHFCHPYSIAGIIFAPFFAIPLIAPLPVLFYF